MTCDLCGQEPCICPACPVCGQKGSILCYAIHGLQPTPAVAAHLVSEFEDGEEEFDNPAKLALKSDELVAEIGPILAGYPPNLQGAVLGDLVAIWVHGHRGADEAFRRDLLKAHLDYVVRLLLHYDSLP